jgi:hypothetical protein
MERMLTLRLLNSMLQILYHCLKGHDSSSLHAQSRRRL